MVLQKRWHDLAHSGDDIEVVVTPIEESGQGFRRSSHGRLCSMATTRSVSILDPI